MAFTDDFDRADDNTTLGTPWTALRGTWGIISNQAYLVATAGNNQNIAVVDGGEANGEVLVTFDSTQIGRDAGVVFRGVDVDNYWMAVLTASAVSLWRVQGGLFANEISRSGQIHAAGDLLRVTFVGNYIHVYVNGASKLTFTSSVHQNATLVGLRNHGNDTVTRFENFGIDALSVPTSTDWMPGTRVAGSVRRYAAIPSGFTPPGRPE